LVMMHAAQAVPSPVGTGAAIDLAFTQSQRYASLRKALAQIPLVASISAQDDVVPHVATRVDVHQWPDGENTDEFILLDRFGPARNVPDRAEIDDAIQRLRATPAFKVLVDESGVLLVRRITMSP